MCHLYHLIFAADVPAQVGIFYCVIFPQRLKNFSFWNLSYFFQQDDCADETRCECRLLTRSEVLRLDKSLQPSFAKGYM